MSLFKRIKEDQLQARKNKDTLRTNLLTTLIGEIQTFTTGGLTASQFGLAASLDSSDADATTIIKKFVKNAEKSLSLRETEQVAQELSILKSYLPQLLTNEEITQLVTSFVTTGKNEGKTGGALLGCVMKQMKEGYADRYDASFVKELVLKL